MRQEKIGSRAQIEKSALGSGEWEHAFHGGKRGRKGWVPVGMRKVKVDKMGTSSSSQLDTENGREINIGLLGGTEIMNL